MYKIKFKNFHKSFLILFVLFLSIFVFGYSAYSGHFQLDTLNLGEISEAQIEDILITELDNAWSKINNADVELSDIIVGIVDTGYDGSHPEFIGINSGATPPEAKSDRGVVEGGEKKSHGTNIAGIIGANNTSVTQNYTPPQMNGVLSGALGLNYTMEHRKRNNETMFSAWWQTRDLVKASPQVVNLSFSGHSVFGAISPFFESIFQKNSDILFIVAAGNNGDFASKFTPGDLSHLPNVITVGATGATEADGHKRFVTEGDKESNFGLSVSIAAPVNLHSPTFYRGDGGTLSLSDYSHFPHTSASTPLVTGVAGLLKAINPNLTPAELKQILVETSDPIQTGETDKRLGTGCYSDSNNQINTGCRLNAHTAVCHEKALNCEEETLQEESIFYDFEDGIAGDPLQTTPLWDRSGLGFPSTVFTTNNPLTGDLAGFVNHTGKIAPGGSHLYHGPVRLLDDNTYKATFWFRHNNELSMQPANTADNIMFAGFRIDNRSCGVIFSTQSSDDLQVHAGLTIGTVTRWSPQRHTFLGYLPNEWTPVQIKANIETGECTTSLMPEGSDRVDYTEEDHLPQDPSSASFIIFSSVNAIVYDPWHIYMDDFGNNDSSLNSHLGEE